MTSLCVDSDGICSAPVRPGAAGKPMPGWDIRVLDEGGHEVHILRLSLSVRLPSVQFLSVAVLSSFCYFSGFLTLSSGGFRMIG